MIQTIGEIQGLQLSEGSAGKTKYSHCFHGYLNTPSVLLYTQSALSLLLSLLFQLAHLHNKGEAVKNNTDVTAADVQMFQWSTALIG